MTCNIIITSLSRVSLQTFSKAKLLVQEHRAAWWQSWVDAEVHGFQSLLSLPSTSRCPVKVK